MYYTDGTVFLGWGVCEWLYDYLMWLVLCEYRIDCRALFLLRKLSGEVKRLWLSSIVVPWWSLHESFDEGKERRSRPVGEILCLFMLGKKAVLMVSTVPSAACFWIMRLFYFTGIIIQVKAWIYYLHLVVKSSKYIVKSYYLCLLSFEYQETSVSWGSCFRFWIWVYSLPLIAKSRKSIIRSWTDHKQKTMHIQLNPSDMSYSSVSDATYLLCFWSYFKQ
jgi:hypothetical protein